MGRTNVSDVKDIAEFDTLTDNEIEAFIEDANQIVTNRLDGHTTASNLELIEKWLAAHLASMKEQRVQREKVGPVTQDYEGGDYGQGLESTRYGQMAISLDPTGRLDVVSRHVKTVNATGSDTDGYHDYYLASDN